MSFRSSPPGLRRLIAPAVAIWSASSAVEGRRVMPSRESASATPPMRLSVFLTASRTRTPASFRSGTMPEKMRRCWTCPAITASLTPPALRTSMQWPSWPRPTQCISSTLPARSGEASSFTATATTRRPARRAAAATRKGKRPLPAMSPSGGGLFIDPPPFIGPLQSPHMGEGRAVANVAPPSSLLGHPVADVALQDHAAPRPPDELDEPAHLRHRRSLRLQPRHGLAGVEAALDEHAEGAPDRADRLGREPPARETDGVHAVDARAVAHR